MSPKSFSTQTDFIPLFEAVALVPYTRDYIGRLAREGKIVSEQIEKQWFVSRQSLFNFFEQNAIEDSVKKRILSLSRKNDLEVKDFYTAKISSIKARQANLPTTSLAMAVLIICGGLLGGLCIQSGTAVMAHVPKTTMFPTLAMLKQVPSQASVVVAQEVASFASNQATEVTEKMSLEKGIVVFPTATEADEEIVATLFSDDVTVTQTSTTTGYVRSRDGEIELPFVRVPQSNP